MEAKSWLESLDTPLIKISAVASTEPVRGHSHFNKWAKPARVQGDCLPGRRQHTWMDGRCYWCNKPRNAKS